MLLCCICRQPIIDHILSHRPQISHYRQAHALKVRYLPPELDAKQLHADFNAANPGSVCSYHTYRRTLRSEHISFAKLGVENCSTCAQLSGQQLRIHKMDAETRRAEYRVDAEGDELVYTADLQKVLMLPKFVKLIKYY